MQMIGFYTYPRITLKSTLHEEDFEREDFPTFIRETVFEYAGYGWLLRIARDGLIQYQCDEIEVQNSEILKTWSEEDLGRARSFEPIWQSYLAHLNIIHFLLDCSLHLNVNMYGLEYLELNYLDTTRVRYLENKAVSQTNYGGVDRDEMIRNGDFRPKSSSDLRRFDIPVSVLEDLCKTYLTPILTSDDNISLLQPIVKALSEHNLRNYDVSLVLCWFATERFINLCWNKLLAERNITGKRKEKLVGRDYSASVKTEILNLEGVLTDAMYESMNTTRVVRNGIAHQFGKRHATKQESIAALNLARSLMEKTLALELPYNVQGLPVHGL